MEAPLQEHLAAVALMSALAEKRQPLNITKAFIQLVEERHGNFHNKEVGWEECKNQVCIDAVGILKNAEKPQVILTPLTFEAYKQFGLQFMQAPFGYVVRLVPPSEMKEAVDYREAEEKRIIKSQHVADLPDTETRIILAD